MTTDELKLFQARVAGLRINPAAIAGVKIHGANGGIIQNRKGNEVSLQIYAAITSNDGYISAAGAKKGLAVYGNSLRDEAKERTGRHPEIDRRTAGGAKKIPDALLHL
ncbi:MAG: DUF2322 family protein [Chloroflexi bacterium]|nr:DUF2322 family protein [Chloroflexota bacterium]